MAIETDRIFRMPGLRLAETQAAHDARVYSYLFTWRSPMIGGMFGACHALELGFVFGTHGDPGMADFSGSGPAADALVGAHDGRLARLRAQRRSRAARAWPLAALHRGGSDDHDLRRAQRDRARAATRRSAARGDAVPSLGAGRDLSAAWATAQIILYEVERGRARITLNRPEKRNALSLQLLEELHEALWDADADREVHAVIVRGAGTCFSAGYDLTEAPRRGGPARRRELPRRRAASTTTSWQLERAQRLRMAIFDMHKPVLAQVHGHCLAGGTDVALLCDMVIAADDATLRLPARARPRRAAEQHVALQRGAAVGQAPDPDRRHGHRRARPRRSGW